MERYLYFTNPNDAGAPNATQELAMYPTSSMFAFNAASATTTEILIFPRDGVDGTASATNDKIVITHADFDHKNVMSSLVSIINAEKNNNPFVVVADKEKGIFNITGVTACAITSAD
tara:strand:- start:126 stop:476 length:351 start_codon:yes stop_codon:yes gene_type:complete